MKKLLKQLTSNVYLSSVGVAIAVAITDYVWTIYISSIADKRAFEAALWAMFVIGLGAFVTVSYVDDRRLIFAACIGAFIGTYLGI